MALSPNLSLIRVTGSYVNAQGQPATGSVTFTLNRVLTDRAANQIILNTPVVVNLVAGAFAVDLPATNDPQMTPSTGVFYTVTEAVGVQSREPFSLPLVYTSAPVDLADVDIVYDVGTGQGSAVLLAHSSLSGLGNNDHPQYVLAAGFSASVQDEIADYLAANGGVVAGHTHTAADINAGLLGVERAWLGGVIVVDKDKPDYGAVGSWPPARPTTRADVLVWWVGSDPGPGTIMATHDLRLIVAAA